MPYDETPPAFESLPASSASPGFDAEASDNGRWRLAAVVGVAVGLVIAASNSFPLQTHQGRLFLFGAGVAIAAWLVLRFIFPEPWQRSMPRG